MKKTVTYIVYIFAAALFAVPLSVHAQTITYTATTQALVNDAKAQVQMLQQEIARYKQTGITAEEKMRLINRIIDLKKELNSTKQKIVAMQQPPVQAEPPQVIRPTVLTPGQLPATLYKGETYTIAWTASNLESIGISMRPVQSTVVGGYHSITNSPIAASTGRYTWKIPDQVANGDYMIYAYNYTNGAQTWSFNPVRIMQKPVPTQQVTLFNPNGGISQFIESDSTYTIEWSTAGSPGQLAINLKGATTQHTLGMHSNPVASKNTFAWNIPAGFAPGKYRIQLVNYETGKIMDESDTTFEIVVPFERIAYITPTSGPVGTEITIVGSYFKKTGNTISFTINGGGLSAVADSPDTKTLKYTIPTEYVLKGTANISVELSNNVPFTIIEPRGSIDIEPLATAYKAGVTYRFVWTGPDLKNVTLYITKAGAEVKKVDIGTLSSKQSYFWRIPSNYVGQYVIKAKTGNNDILIANDTFTVQGSTAYQMWDRYMGAVIDAFTPGR